jgi:D-arabinitol 4-dehydrogenase
MMDPDLRMHFDRWEEDEVLPGLTVALPFNKHDYLNQIADRFCNSAIADQLERICMDGFAKMQIYIKPTIESCLKQGITPVNGMKTIASWFVYARRFAAGKTQVDYIEPSWALIEPYLHEGREEAFASMESLWGDLPKRHPEFVPSLINSILEMEQQWPA